MAWIEIGVCWLVGRAVTVSIIMPVEMVVVYLVVVGWGGVCRVV